MRARCTPRGDSRLDLAERARPVIGERVENRPVDVFVQAGLALAAATLSLTLPGVWTSITRWTRGRSARPACARRARKGFNSG